MELDDSFTRDVPIIYDQSDALENADFVYVKSWASYKNYGQLHTNASNWMITREKLRRTRNAKIMHCLPVRRDVELGADVLDSAASLVLQQAINRVWSAQAVLKQLLEKNFASVQKTETLLQHA
jgi:N-succinyl-L-ornithine transcarbamylase